MGHRRPGGRKQTAATAHCLPRFTATKSPNRWDNGGRREGEWALQSTAMRQKNLAVPIPTIQCHDSIPCQALRDADEYLDC